MQRLPIRLKPPSANLRLNWPLARKVCRRASTLFANARVLLPLYSQCDTIRISPFHESSPSTKPGFIVARLVLCTVLILHGLFPTTWAQADDSELQAEIEKLFQVGWDTSSASRAAADQQFQKMAVASQAHPSANYAYALVLLKQRRYDEAAKPLDSAVAGDPTNWSARQNKIRLLMLTKKYDAALVELDRMSKQLAEASEDQLPPSQRREVVAFLGRMIGFLEGPAERDVAASSRRRVQRQVESVLTEQELLQYDEARDGVLARFTEIAEASQRGREEALAEKERQREDAARDLEERRAKQQERRAELLDRADKIRQEMRDNQAELTKAEQPLLDRLARINRQAEIPRREIALLITEADSLRAAAARLEDPIERDRLLFRARQLEIAASRYDADLAALERQAAAINVERARLQKEFQRNNGALVNSLRTIENELVAIQRSEKRNALDERRLEKPLTSGTRAVRALEAEAGAFTTYEPFPLEEDRQRLLDSLANPR